MCINVILFVIWNSSSQKWKCLPIEKGWSDEQEDFARNLWWEISIGLLLVTIWACGFKVYLWCLGRFCRQRRHQRQVLNGSRLFSFSKSTCVTRNPIPSGKITTNYGEYFGLFSVERGQKRAQCAICSQEKF